MSLLMFPGSTFLASRCVGSMKPVLWAEAPGYITRHFSQGDCSCVQPVVSALPCGGGLPRTVLPIVTVLWCSKCQPSWPPSPGDQGCPCVDCVHPLAFSRELESVADGVHSLASERLWEVP